MDFSFLILFGLAVVVAAVLTIGATMLKLPESYPRAIAFVVCFSAALLLARPWATFERTEWRKLAAITLVMAVWVAFGSIAGGALGRRYIKNAK